MPLHPSQVFKESKELIEKAFKKGENYQTIAKLTNTSDATVRNWHRRGRAKLSAIQPLIDRMNSINIEKNAKEFDDISELLPALKKILVEKTKNYIERKTDLPPIADAQFISILEKM
ncbi:MAG: hypothetical protein PVI90_17155 [Desulfobacteraceae bacterium]|jgi:hypothetical protein